MKYAICIPLLLLALGGVTSYGSPKVDRDVDMETLTYAKMTTFISDTAMDELERQYALDHRLDIPYHHGEPTQPHYMKEELLLEMREEEEEETRAEEYKLDVEFPPLLKRSVVRSDAEEDGTSGTDSIDKRLILSFPNLTLHWDQGIVHYVVGEIDSEEANKVREVMDKWEHYTMFRFVLKNVNDTSTPYIRLVHTSENSCYAGTGSAENYSGGVYNVSCGCLGKTKCIHVMGHVLGLNHEQQRPDRGDYEMILMDNMEPGPDAYNANMLRKYLKTHVKTNSVFDYSSVMHTAALKRNCYMFYTNFFPVAKHCKDPASSCGVHLTPTNATTTIAPSDVFRYECNTGLIYKHGDMLRRCTDTGKLSGMPPHCVKPGEGDTASSTTDIRRRSHFQFSHYILTGDNSNLNIPYDGKLKQWRFYNTNRGALELLVWRKHSATSYTLIGKNDVPVVRHWRVVKVDISPSKQIPVKKGDLIGFLFQGGTIGGVSYDRCVNALSPEGHPALTSVSQYNIGQLVVGQKYAFSSVPAVRLNGVDNTCRIYSMVVTVGK